ncbi:hypothetical protein U1Q18_020787 [Sarracenia purpurea var. burkii]
MVLEGGLLGSLNPCSVRLLGALNPYSVKLLGDLNPCSAAAARGSQPLLGKATQGSQPLFEGDHRRFDRFCYYISVPITTLGGTKVKTLVSSQTLHSRTRVMPTMSSGKKSGRR